jgi:hypothetical protein
MSREKGYKNRVQEHVDIDDRRSKAFFLNFQFWNSEKTILKIEIELREEEYSETCEL